MSKNYYDCNYGYYRVSNVYRDRPLANMPFGSCRIIETENAIYLKSYTTFVLKLDKKTNFLQCTGVYSRTTMKHIGAWLKEIAPAANYYTAKNCYLNHMAFNVLTGELKPEKIGNTDLYGFYAIDNKGDL